MDIAQGLAFYATDAFTLASEYPFMFGLEDNDVTVTDLVTYGLSQTDTILLDGGETSLYFTPFDRKNVLVKRTKPLGTKINSNAEFELPAKSY
jgi:hypothetical protein